MDSNSSVGITSVLSGTTNTQSSISYLNLLKNIDVKLKKNIIN